MINVLPPLDEAPAAFRRAAMISALAFDMTGVITRSPIRVLEDYGARLELPAGTIAKFFKSKMFDEVLLGRAPMSALVGDLVVTIRRDFDTEVDPAELYSAMRASRQIDPEVAALITDLGPRYRLVVLTNNTTDVVESPGSDESWWTDDGEHPLSPSDFEFVMSSNELGLVKPDPRIYQALVERLGVPASEVVYIDDTAANLPAATALGMTTIEFKNVVQCRASLSWLGIGGLREAPDGGNSSSHLH